MVIFTNIHGQEPSPALPPHVPQPRRTVTFVDPQTKKTKTRAVKTHQPIVQRVGREGIDLTACQAPTSLAPDRHSRMRCFTWVDRAAGTMKPTPATCVIVENKPRPNGAIGGMALCDRCYKMVLATQGPNYAKATPLTP